MYSRRERRGWEGSTAPMALILFHTRSVTNALKSRAPLGVDLLLLGAIAGLAAGVILFGERFTSPFTEKVNIDLSYWSLPKYVLYTSMRGVAAYFLSLTFTLIYGTTAAHSAKAERVMLPILDILQAIPVLSFLPGAVLALIALFPRSQVGLELACILMIFTGQAWNMTFSFHGSLKGIPAPLREVARLNRYSRWQTFRYLEVPSAMIGLIWNSMMSMAGGWFFLTTVEAFTLKDRDFRLPGLGSYMAEANQRHDIPAIVAGSIAMILMIVAFDQILWRPLVVWSQKFKLEENTEARSAQSWVLTMFQQSQLLVWLTRHFKSERPTLRLPFKHRPALANGAPDSQDLAPSQLRVVIRWGVSIACLALALYGLVALIALILRVHIIDPANHEDWVTILLALLASFIRTSSAVLLGALWTLPLGIVIGRSPRLSNIFQPIIQTLASYPAPMVFPIVTAALVFLHVPFNLGCTLLLLMGAQWYVLFNVIAGAMAIPADLKEVCEAYSMPKRQRWTKLYIPCVFPYLVTGLITAAGGAWNATIVAEYLDLGQGDIRVAFGLGAKIAKATADGNFPILAASTISMAVFVVLLNRFFWKHMYRLAEDRYSLNT
ncbi:MAG TPA: ABC transporter permease subunit [Phycisphaerae bacterium]|nr:ABC transporter permease subunit [Phycisphaerae bacterium]